MLLYILEKKLLHPGMMYIFGDYSYSVCLWGLKACWLAGFMVCLCIVCTILINTLRPKQHGRHFADDIFKCVLLNENVWMSIKISLTFVPKDLVNNIPALVQIMAWRRPGDKPLSEATMVRLPMHICVTWPQWVNVHFRLFYDIYWYWRNWLHEHT